MKNKTIAIIGIVSFILSVITSAEDLEGNFILPIVLIAISGIITIIFIVMATARLWKKGARPESIMLVSSAIILFVLTVVREVTLLKYGSPIIILLNVTRIIYFIAFVWVVSLLWTMAKHEGLAKKTIKDSGLTPEEGSLVQKDLRQGNQEAAVQRITTAQERPLRQIEDLRKQKGISETLLIEGETIALEDPKEVNDEQ